MLHIARSLIPGHDQQSDGSELVFSRVRADILPALPVLEQRFGKDIDADFLRLVYELAEEEDGSAAPMSEDARWPCLEQRGCRSVSSGRERKSELTP